MPKRSKHTTWQEAIANGIVTPEQVKEARLTPTAARVVIPSPPTPQDLLTQAVERLWPGEAVANFPPLLPDRKFELDIAFPAHKLGVEVDGWQFHGQHKVGFHRDREKARLLVLAGWRVLPFAASEIIKDMPMVLDTIQQGFVHIPAFYPSDLVYLHAVHTELKRRFPDEVRCTRRGLAFPSVQLLVEIDPWVAWMRDYGTVDWDFEGWTVLHVTGTRETQRSPMLDVNHICTAYAEAEERGVANQGENDAV